jgi:NAD(P)-dependent dehydrogenase (short-subunit alcohol dehydrogenase family)
MNFEGQLIVVTGAGSGIGEQVSRDLIDNGAKVLALGRNSQKLRELTDAYDSSKIDFISCDVADGDFVKEVFKEIAKDHGIPFGLVNSAGINPSRNKITKTSEKDWDLTINTNLKGTFNCIKQVVPLMEKANRGSIVNISSIAGIFALENRAAYSASKSGIVGLTQSVAIDYASSNIRVNCICPGYVETPLVSNYLKNLSKKENDNLTNAHLLGRLGKVSEVSNFVLFLLSNLSSWTTGAVIPVDGGYTIGKKI